MTYLVCNRRCVGFFVLLAIIFALSFSPANVVREDVNVDSASYVSHAFTLGLDFDLDYTNEPAYRECYNRRTEMPCHPIGVGLMAAPFVHLFSYLDRLFENLILSDHSNFQYSWSHFGFVFSGLIFLLWGTFLFYKALVLIGYKMPRWIVAMLAWSFGMLYYTLNMVVMPHVFEFFSLALVFFGSARLWRSRRVSELTAASGLLVIGIVLTILVRPANFNVFALPILVILAAALSESSAWAGLMSAWKIKLTWIVGGFLLASAVIGAVNLRLYDDPFPSMAKMYQSTMFDFGEGKETEELVSSKPVESNLQRFVKALSLLPNTLKVIFSSEFGLLYCAPVLFIGSVLVLIMPFRNTGGHTVGALGVSLASLGYLLLPLAIVLYWGTTGSNYGYRYLFGVFPVALLGVAMFYRLGGQNIKGFVISVLLGLSFFALLSQMFWGTSASLHFTDGTNVFGRYHQYGANGYVLALAEAVLDLNAWVSMFAHRLPGYLGAVGLDAFGVSVEAVGHSLGIAPDKLETGMARYMGLPWVVHVQIAILFLVWSFGGTALLASRHRSHARGGDSVPEDNLA